jgi:hypothetical protein
MRSNVLKTTGLLFRIRFISQSITPFFCYLIFKEAALTIPVNFPYHPLNEKLSINDWIVSLSTGPISIIW